MHNHQLQNIPNTILSTQTKGQSQTCKIIISSLIIILLTAFISYTVFSINIENISNLNYPANSHSQICRLKYPTSFPFLYIELNTKQPLYYCVDHCPSGWNQFIISDSNGEEHYASNVQELNVVLGGICWSEEKEKILKKRGFYQQLFYKEDIVGNFKDILIVTALCFAYSLLLILMFYYLPVKFTVTGSVILGLTMVAAIMVYSVMANTNLASIIIFGGALLFFMILNLVYGIKKVKQSQTYINSIFNRIQANEGNSFLYSSIFNIFIYNLINITFLLFLLFQYLCLISSQKQLKQTNNIYFTVEKTYWKYICLFIQWFLLSNFIKQIYTYSQTKLGFSLYLYDSCLKSWNSNDFLNINLQSFYQFVLWLPLKIVEMLKPQGATIRQLEEQELSHRVTKACYCCCGFFINKLHKYTFNPYLILILNPECQSLQRSLLTIQQSFHRHDNYDKSSLWIYRLFNYIVIIIGTFLYMSITNIDRNSLSLTHSIFFLVFAIVLAVEVSKININYWSLLVQVAQFLAINRK